MADEKLNTGPAENTSPEAAGPITTPEQAAASEPRQEQTGPAIPEPGDVVVSFDKINELMAEKRQNARAEVEKAETPETPEAAAPGETPQPANTEEPKKLRRGRPPKADKTTPDKPKPSKRDKPYTRVHSRSGTSSNYGKFERQGSESNDGRRYPGNVLFVPTVSGGIHPTQKPVELCEYLIRTYTRPGELVADICAGSGTTAISAINTERRFVCFETAPAFYAAASERIRAARNET